MRRQVILLICLFMISVSIAYAEAIETASSVPAVAKADQQHETIKPQQWLRDTGAVWTIPKVWDSADWSRLALYGGLTYLIHEKDDYLQHRFQEKRSKKTNKIADVGNAFPAVGAVYLTGTYFSGNEQQRKFAAAGLESMTIALLTAEVISFASDRDRPNGKQHSFPSSHTAAAFALATVVADEYGNDNKAVPYFAYGLAALTGYGRLNDNKHWGADVVAGALLGHYTAKTVGKLHTARHVKLQPYVSSNTRGVVMNKQF